jgi:hypothetical protein
MMPRIDSLFWKISTGRHFQNGHHNTARIQHWPISTPFDMWVDYGVPNDSCHRHISTGRYFQNGRHNTAQIQHCPISSKFDMWVDNDVPNWFSTSKNFFRRHFQNGPRNTAHIQHCSISTSWIDFWHWKISTGLHFQIADTIPQQFKVAFNLFFKRVVSGRFGRLHNR